MYLMDAESWAVVASCGELQDGVGDLFRQIFTPTNNDGVVVGVDGRRAFPARDAFPGCLLRTGSGPSGGERSIINSLDLAHTVRTYSGVTICSGDGEFAPLARSCWESGLRVRIASWRIRLAPALAQAEYELVFLDNYATGPAALPAYARSLRVRHRVSGQLEVAA